VVSENWLGGKQLTIAFLCRRSYRQNMPGSERKKTVPNALIGAAGVYYVASELLRRGLIALPTMRNTKGYDIIVANPNGINYANIDVKTSQNRVDHWPMPSSSAICCGPNDYYVLLRWVEKEKRLEVFMLKGVEAKEEVVRSEQEDPWNVKQRSEGKPTWAVVYVGKNVAGRDAEWKKRWETWTL
jgi:hypothetical protein